jgi:hypothetical protein
LKAATQSADHPTRPVDRDINPDIGHIQFTFFTPYQLNTKFPKSATRASSIGGNQPAPGQRAAAADQDAARRCR